MLDRNQQGKFIQGNKASPGRPRLRTESEYLGRLTSLLTPEKWDQIVNRAIKDAIKGSATARAWLSDYVIGKPVTTISLVASEQVLLNQLLERMQATGVSPSGMFLAMLNELAEADVKNHE